jgi:O-antigen ligase
MGVNLIFNYRSPVLFLLVTMVLVLPIIPEQVGLLRILPRAGSVLRVLVLAGIALGAGLASEGLIHLVTSLGLVGEDAQAKNQSQFQSSQGFLLGGRPEILVSSRAVLESPILGHGSGAKDMKYVEMLSDIQAEEGMKVDLQDEEESFQGLIPAHSHLMGAWVQAGIVGALFWAYIFRLTAKALVRVAVLRPALSPVYAFMLVGFLWDILFSPFGSFERFLDALLIVIILDLLESAPRVVRVLGWFRRSAWRRHPGRRNALTSRSNATYPHSDPSPGSLTD